MTFENGSTEVTPTPEDRQRASERIDHLAAIARQQQPGDISATNDMWRAMFELDSWFFLARGEMPNVHPFVGTVGQHLSLLAFTSPARVREFGLKNGFSEKDASLVLAIPVGDAPAYCGQFQADGVQNILVDQGHTGFFVPLQQLVPIREYLKATAAPSA